MDVETLPSSKNLDTRTCTYASLLRAKPCEAAPGVHEVGVEQHALQSRGGKSGRDQLEIPS